MHFSKGHPEEISYPVRSIRKLDVEGTQVVSVRRGKKNGLENPYTEKNLPQYHQEVMEVREMLQKGEYPHEFMRQHYPWDQKHYPEELMPGPLYAMGLMYSDPKGCADIVHMDHSADLPLAIQDWLVSQGVKPRSKRTKFLKEFIGTIPKATRYITRKQDMAVERGFQSKYYFGVIRPEEYSGGAEMTAYEEGCPSHPSFPAGHGCLAGSAAKAIIDYYRLTEEQEMVVKNCAYLFSQWRTFACVHWSPDNLAGLEIGGLLEKGYTKERYNVK